MKISNSQYCLDNCGKLAEIKDVTENNKVISFLSFADTGKASKFWIGLTDLVTEGVYVWNTPTETSTYRYWAAGEPSMKAAEDCVNIDSGADRFWKESNCGITTCLFVKKVSFTSEHVLLKSNIKYGHFYYKTIIGHSLINFHQLRKEHSGLVLVKYF